MSVFVRMGRWLLGAFALALLSGCQTAPASDFSAAQRAVFAKHGFIEQGGKYLLSLQNRLLFTFDSSELDGERQVMLAELGRELAMVGIGSAGIDGHASGEGDPQYNLKLSERRAQAVSSALVAGGLDGQRMRVRGFGHSDPVASNDDPEGRKENRRVVIILTPTDALPLRSQM